MSHSSKRFPTTSRTLIEEINASDPQRRHVSLERFCAQYYPPIYGYARALGLSEADAKDRVQDFFVEVIRDDLLAKYDLSRDRRLSTWLMKCFKHLVLNHQAYAAAGKRGGGREFVEFDPDHAEHAYRSAHLAQLEPGPTFDLMLARQIWQVARASLAGKHREKGKGDLVDTLLPLVLMDRWPPPPVPSQEEVAGQHGTTVLRLKAFFNRTLRMQAARQFAIELQTASPGITEEEIDHLWSLLRRHGEA